MTSGSRIKWDCSDNNLSQYQYAWGGEESFREKIKIFRKNGDFSLYDADEHREISIALENRTWILWIFPLTRYLVINEKNMTDRSAHPSVYIDLKKITVTRWEREEEREKKEIDSVRLITRCMISQSK